MTEFKCEQCKWYDITGDNLCTVNRKGKVEITDVWWINQFLGITFKECIMFGEK